MLNKNKINKKKGLVFFIEGFSGSGKSSIGIQSHKKIIKLFGPTIIIHGNEMRDMLELHGFSKSERSKSAYKSRRIIEFIVNQKINVIYAVLCLNYKTKAIYKEKLKNLIEIYIKSDIKTIVENKKKKRNI